MKLLLKMALVASMFVLASCGEKVNIPSAHVGFVKTGDGIEEEVREPSSFRLPVVMPWSTEKPQLLIVETSNFAQKESMKVFVPKDELNFQFDIRGIYSISKENSKNIIDKVAIGNSDKSVVKYPSQSVYEIYARQIVRTKSRAVISKYSISHVISNIESVSQEIESLVASDLKNTPVSVVDLNIASAQPPEIIVKAQELAKQREIAIRNAEADKMVALKMAESKLEVARKQQEIDLLEAETQVLVEKKLSESVNEAFVTQRMLRIWDKMSASDNVIIMPMEAMKNPSIMMGVSQKSLSNK